MAGAEGGVRRGESLIHISRVAPVIPLLSQLEECLVCSIELLSSVCCTSCIAGTSLIIHNSGLPAATLISFIWVLGGMCVAWILVKVSTTVRCAYI